MKIENINLKICKYNLKISLLIKWNYGGIIHKSGINKDTIGIDSNLNIITGIDTYPFLFRNKEQAEEFLSDNIKYIKKYYRLKKKQECLINNK